MINQKEYNYCKFKLNKIKSLDLKKIYQKTPQYIFICGLAFGFKQKQLSDYDEFDVSSLLLNISKVNSKWNKLRLIKS